MSSILLPDCETVTEANYHGLIAAPVEDGQPLGSGYIPRDWSVDPFGGFAAPFNLPTIPRSEWPRMIEEREAIGVTNRQLLKEFAIAPLNQGQTNYCWCNAVVSALHIILAGQGSLFERLSPASAAAPIKGFQNRGGWGIEAVKWIAEHGINSVDEWPANKIDKSLYTTENKAKAARRKITEWYDLKPNSIDQLVTCLLNGIPVALGLDWWGHEILAVDPAIENGNLVIVIQNSWGEGWGDKGLGKLSEAKARAADQVAPRTVTPLAKSKPAQQSTVV